ncbi:MAG: hypothetical protein ABIJ56_05530 [Pseudomonadota bacterium]
MAFKVLFITALAAAACSAKKPPAVHGALPEDKESAATLADLPADAEEEAAPDPVNRVAVEFHVMSQCPFASKALQEIKTVLDELGEHVDFKLHFIATRNTDGSFKSLHGQSEVDGDIVQLCAAKVYPDDHRYMDIVACMVKDFKNIPHNWAACASKSGLDTADMEGCVSRDEGKALLAASIEKSKEARATGSPTMFIGGNKYGGDRSAQSFKLSICCAFEPGEAPDACEREGQPACPEDVEVELIVLSDKRNDECGKKAGDMIRTFEDKVPNLAVTHLDYSDQEGKELFVGAGLAYLPALFFTKNVEKVVGSWMAKNMQPFGDLLVLKSYYTFDPTKEICDNGVDDTGDGKADCDDADCKGKLICRKKKPGHLAMFAMSQCPYGIKAEEALGPVLQYFKDKLKFSIHFLVEILSEQEFAGATEWKKKSCVKKSDGQYYCALHGPGELDENIRQACAIKHFAKDHKYMDYIACRNADIKDPDWEQCAVASKVKPKKIEKCAGSQEGLDLIKADAGLAKDLGFTGCPTFLINNNVKADVSSRTFEGFKQAVCEHNKDMTGCK